VESSVRLIVGLGNPGAEYAWTPHNLGFLVVDALAERAGARVDRPEAKSYIGRGKLGEHEVLLAKPQTYMNLSGFAVGELAKRYELEPRDVIVVVDDVALPWGMLRVRERGSAGGHNGLKSIIGALGSQEFARVRIGIHPDHPVGDLGAFVLAPMRGARKADAVEVVMSATDAVEMILKDGLHRAMNTFNRKVGAEEEEQ
jgi:PTH1 family peptidyl-tRNA hydrolase